MSEQLTQLRPETAQEQFESTIGVHDSPDHHDHSHHHEHGHADHVCDSCCQHTEGEAGLLADSVFEQHNHAGHGELGHHCDATCQHSQEEAAKVASDLFEPHSHSHHHEHGHADHVCDSCCQHTEGEASKVADALFEEKSEREHDRDHACTASCEHTQIDANVAADRLFGDDESSPRDMPDEVTQTSRSAGLAEHKKTAEPVEAPSDSLGTPTVLVPEAVDRFEAQTAPEISISDHSAMMHVAEPATEQMPNAEPEGETRFTSEVKSVHDQSREAIEPNDIPYPEMPSDMYVVEQAADTVNETVKTEAFADSEVPVAEIQEDVNTDNIVSPEELPYLTKPETHVTTRATEIPVSLPHGNEVPYETDTTVNEYPEVSASEAETETEPEDDHPGVPIHDLDTFEPDEALLTIDAEDTKALPDISEEDGHEPDAIEGFEEHDELVDTAEEEPLQTNSYDWDSVLDSNENQAEAPNEFDGGMRVEAALVDELQELVRSISVDNLEAPEKTEAFFRKNVVAKLERLALHYGITLETLLHQHGIESLANLSQDELLQFLRLLTEQIAAKPNQQPTGYVSHRTKTAKPKETATLAARIGAMIMAMIGTSYFQEQVG